MESIKAKALDYANMMISAMSTAVRKNTEPPEQIERYKEQGRMWLYIRDLVEKDGESDGNNEGC